MTEEDDWLICCVFANLDNEFRSSMKRFGQEVMILNKQSLIRVRHVRRPVLHEELLFPGYAFVKIAPGVRDAAALGRGFGGWLLLDGDLAVLPGTLLRHYEKLFSLDPPEETSEVQLSPGDVVRVVEDLFRGKMAKVVSYAPDGLCLVRLKENNLKVRLSPFFLERVEA